MPVFVAIDCEMVGSGNKELLAKVSIVDRQGSILLNEYVKPTAPVTDYRTFVSGIRRKDLVNGKTFNDVQSRVSSLISGKVLVGHSLRFDLDALGLSHPECNRRDLAKYGPFMKNDKPQSLRFLAKEHLHMDIQEGEHDSVEDARAAMELYNSVANNWN